MSHDKDFLNKLRTIVELKNIKIDEPMKNHTHFEIGGPADILITPATFEEIKDVIEVCNCNKVPYFILGNGSNLLVKDGGIRGVVIKLSNLNKITVEGEKVIAQSGATLKEVSDNALAFGLTGFEFACGIPGSVGGATAMNAGAYHGDISHVVESALVVNDKGQIVNLNKEELELEYRNSAILKYGYTVLETTFALELGEKQKIKDRIDDLTKKRTDLQPLEYPSAGSTFKRPEGHFTGKLIQDSGLKGMGLGGAQVSAKHSGFIINKENASAKDVLDLISFVQKTVKEKFGVELHTEVRIMGEDLK